MKLPVEYSPPEFPRNQVHGNEISITRTHVDRTIGNRSRGVDRVSRLVGPE